MRLPATLLSNLLAWYKLHHRLTAEGCSQPKSHQKLVCLQESLPFTSVPNDQENLQASVIPPFQSLVILPEVPNLVRGKTAYHSSA